jgi:Protein of unknown function (DUF2846)
LIDFIPSPQLTQEKIMNRRLTFSLLVATLVTACATASGPEFSQLQASTTNEGNLYIYRKPAIYAVAATYDVIDQNKKVVAGLVSGSYVVLPLKSGKHTFSISEGFGTPKSFDIAVDPGKNYFVEYDASKGLLLGWGILSEAGSRSQEQALADLKGLKRNN